MKLEYMNKLKKKKWFCKTAEDIQNCVSQLKLNRQTCQKARTGLRKNGK